MKIALAGSTGFVGRHLKAFLSHQGYELYCLTRKHFTYSDQALSEYIKGIDVVINLTGAPVIKRWTFKHKMEIFNSRIKTTRKLVAAMALLDIKPECFINASAIGVYDYEHVSDEFSSHFGSNFLADVVKKWEEEGQKAVNQGIRTCITRFGVVLGKDGGAFPEMYRPFKYGLGGKIGSGKQVMSFIHIQDLLKASLLLIQNTSMNGVYNFVAPYFCTNNEFTKALSEVSHKPAMFIIPTFIIRLLYGKAAEVVVGGEKVLPKRLLDVGFEFAYPNITKAVENLLSH